MYNSALRGLRRLNFKRIFNISNMLLTETCNRIDNKGIEGVLK